MSKRPIIRVYTTPKYFGISASLNKSQVEILNKAKDTSNFSDPSAPPVIEVVCTSTGNTVQYTLRKRMINSIKERKRNGRIYYTMRIAR